ncbi:MAG: hypothetical protein JWN17_722 [Frankiales bacterium]|nr:hypothetical protein [Frankiales bacterium]
MTEQEPLLAFAQGDPAEAAELRRSLQVLSDRSDDPAFRELVAGVLAGRTPLRLAALDPAFARGVTPGVDRAAAAWRDLPAEERERMLDEARARLDDEQTG